MKRIFRRRPAHWVTLALLLAVYTAAQLSCLDREVGSNNEPPALPEAVYPVERAVDGDTIIVQDDGQRVRVRLIGIDTPEVFDKSGSGERLTKPEPFGEDASAFTSEFIAGGEVRLQFGRRRVDRYDRLLAYVFVADKMLNEELARAGLARVKIYAGDESPLSRRIEKAQDEAKSRQRGIWSIETP